MKKASIRINKKYLIVISICFILAGAFIFYQSVKYPFINNKVNEVVKKESNGVYDVAYESITVDEINGNLILTNVRLIADTLRQQQLIAAGDTTASKMLLDVFVPRIEVLGFKTARALLSQKLDCNTIRITDPKAMVYLFPNQEKQKAKEQPKPELYKQILGNMKMIYADTVAIVNAEVEAIDFANKKTQFHTYNTNINLHQVRIDSAYYHDTTRTLFSKFIRVSTSRVLLGSKGKEAEIKDLAFDTDSKKLQLSSFEYDAYKVNSNFKALAQNITLEDLEWKGAAEYSDLLIGNVVVQKAELEQTNGENKKEQQPDNKRILTGWIKTFGLGRLQVKSFSLKNKYTDPDKRDITVANSSFNIQNIHIDSTAVMNETLFEKIKKLELTNKMLEFISEDKKYVYRLTDLHLNTSEKKFTIGQVKIIPQLSEAAFAKASKIQKDRFELVSKNIICTGINIGKLAKIELFMKEVTSSHNTLTVSRDLHQPPDNSSKIGKFPHQLLMKIKVPVKVDKVVCNDVHVFYRENSAIGDSIGVVSFTNGKLTIENVRNGEGGSGIATARFTTSFLEQIPLSGTFTFYLDKWKNGDFRVQVATGKPFDGTVLNKISIPLSLNRIEKGRFNSISCDIMGNNNRATGTVTMTYENLKISLLKRKEDEINRKTVLSLLANLLVKNNNRRANMRVAKVDVDRDPTQGFFKYTWTAIFSGGREILGLKP
ncbi:hypothetical protein [Aridibaculum aurantiacum]|uniref:hypothetical protein n=1 Tax=Aridibaculum aurantiacum TaxID=2810307 RepID=UPI001A95BA87|nr:hypothetical protein [Aridibaculum aurantiacum]